MSYRGKRLVMKRDGRYRKLGYGFVFDSIAEQIGVALMNRFWEKLGGKLGSRLFDRLWDRIYGLSRQR